VAVTDKATSRSHEALIADLVSKQQIHEAHMRYFRGVDRCDAELINSAFHPDASAEHGPLHLTGDSIGPELVAAMASRYDGTLHVAANELVELVGDAAFSEIYALNHHLFTEGSTRFILQRAIRYVDRFERRDGDWRIHHRRVVCEWDEIRPMLANSALPEYEPSFRSRQDSVYDRSVPEADEHAGVARSNTIGSPQQGEQ
jgi:hypothetical protein